MRASPSKVVDEDGIWTGSWRVPVKFQVDPSGFGGWRHPPSMIVLWENRGLIYYVGQPKLCRRCGVLGHLVEACNAMVCQKCQEVGHEAAACPTGRKCNLCGDSSHMFRDCPDSFANRTRRGRPSSRARQQEGEERKAGEAGEPGGEAGKGEGGEGKGKEEAEAGPQEGEGGKRETGGVGEGGGQWVSEESEAGTESQQPGKEKEPGGSLRIRCSLFFRPFHAALLLGCGVRGNIRQRGLEAELQVVGRPSSNDGL